MPETEKEYWEKEPWSLLIKRYDVSNTTLEIQIKYPTILERIVDQFEIDLLDAGKKLEPRRFKALTLAEISEEIRELNK